MVYLLYSTKNTELFLNNVLNFTTESK